MTVFLANLLKPFVLLALLLLVYPARLAVTRWMREGRLKSYLLQKV